MEIKNEKGLIGAIITMSFLQMATNAVASILPQIALAFPEASTAQIQYLMTFPNLMAVVFSLVAVWANAYVSKRFLSAFGLMLGVFAGIMSFRFHNSLGLLYLWAAFLGAGIGCVVPMATSLVTECFPWERQAQIMGYQTFGSNFGSMAMTFCAGLLATIAWQYNYLVYCIVIPATILSLLYIPKTYKISANKKQKIHKISKKTALYLCLIVAYMVLFSCAPTNIAMLMQEKQIGAVQAAGAATTLLLLGGTLAGATLGLAVGLFKDNTICVGLLGLIFGFGCMYASSSAISFFVGCFFVGVSNSLVLPQCMLNVAKLSGKENNTFAMALGFSCANLGAFMSPIISTISHTITGSQLAESRILVAMILAAVVLGLCVLAKIALLYQIRLRR